MTWLKIVNAEGDKTYINKNSISSIKYLKEINTTTILLHDAIVKFDSIIKIPGDATKTISDLLIRADHDSIYTIGE